MKKIAKVFVASSVLLAMALVSCGNRDGASKVKRSKDAVYQGYAAEIDPATGKVYDFGGMNVIVYDWWSNPDQAPGNKQQEDQKAFRDWCAKTYNYTIVQKDLAGWGANPTETTNFCIAADPSVYALLTIDGRNAISGLMNGLWADLSKTNIDWSKKKWNKPVLDMFKEGEAFYTMATGVSEPRNLVFFNKRILQEAGIDPELPYDLQKEGKWTWDEFEKLLQATTKDTDNDGVLDQYAIGYNDGYIVTSAMVANGVNMIYKENGKFKLDVNSDAAIEAWEFFKKIHANYRLPKGDGAWNYYQDAFKNGETAFCIEQGYMVMPGNSWADMKDDFGAVTFPAGPRVQAPALSTVNDNMIVIPAYYDDATIAKIAKIYDFYTEEVPGYDDAEAWKEGYYPQYRDARAIDETLQLVIDKSTESLSSMIPGLDLGPLFIWSMPWGDTSEIIESGLAAAQPIIDKVNGDAK